jgi:hypothetical protein
MILRRVIQHFRHQEWTAIFIDFLIVVFGVFMGIQVANWNQAQNDKLLGETFTERLNHDLVVEAWAYFSVIEYLNDVQTTADIALAGLEGTNNISDEERLIAAYRATQYSPGIRQRTTYDELISTGKIALITDQALANIASLIYTNTPIGLINDEGANSAYRVIFRKTVPVTTQDTLAQFCGDRFVVIGDFSGIKHPLHYPCKTDLNQDQIAQAVSLLRSNPAVIENLRLRAMNVRSLLSNMIFDNQDIFKALEDIKNAANPENTAATNKLLAMEASLVQ